MASKGGEKMKVSKQYVIALTITTLLTITIKSLLSFEALVNLFLLFFLINLLIALYALYTLYEMNFLHEKQVSKLVMSKNKLNISL